MVCGRRKTEGSVTLRRCGRTGELLIEVSNLESSDRGMENVLPLTRFKEPPPGWPAIGVPDAVTVFTMILLDSASLSEYECLWVRFCHGGFEGGAVVFWNGSRNCTGATDADPSCGVEILQIMVVADTKAGSVSWS